MPKPWRGYNSAKKFSNPWRSYPNSIVDRVEHFPRFVTLMYVNVPSFSYTKNKTLFAEQSNGHRTSEFPVVKITAVRLL